MNLKEFVELYELKSPKYVDLSFVGGGGHYYSNLLNAVSDVNNGTLTNASSQSANAVCEVFYGEEATVVRIIKDCEVSDTVDVNVPMVFDLNDCTVSLAESATAVYAFSSTNDIVLYGKNKHLSKIEKISSTSNTVGINVLVGTTYCAVINCTVICQSNATAAYGMQVKSRLLDIINSDFYISGNAENLTCIRVPSTSTQDKIDVCIRGCCFKSNSTRSESINLITALGLYFRGNYTITDSYIYASSKEFDANSAGAIATVRNEQTLIYLRNNYIFGITYGAAVHVKLFSENNEFVSLAHHGGVYVGEGGKFYDHGSTFTRYDVEEGYEDGAFGCTYVSYGSTAYFDGSKFFHGNTQAPLAITSTYGNGGTVYISNSEVPYFRVDGVKGENTESKLYIGENVTIRNPEFNIYTGIVEQTGENYRADFPISNPSIPELLESMINAKSALLDIARKTDSELPLNENTMIETLVTAMDIPNGNEVYY